MTVSYLNMCYNEVCYKGTALYYFLIRVPHTHPEKSERTSANSMESTSAVHRSSTFHGL